MPGINTSGTANTNDYSLGRGILYFSSLDSNDNPSAYRDLGNATEFTVTLESETLEHQSSRQGIRVTDAEVIVSQTVSVSFTLDEINFNNLADFFSGTATAVANPVDDTQVTDVSDETIAASAVGGSWYDLVDGSGNRLYDIASRTESSGTPSGAAQILIHGATTSAPYTAAQVEVDLEMGRVFVPEGSTAVGARLAYTLNRGTTPSGTSPTIDRVTALSESQVVGALKFISENPVQDFSPKTEYQFHKVTLAPEGDLPLIGDEFMTISFSGSAGRASAARTGDLGNGGDTLTITTYDQNPSTAF